MKAFVSFHVDIATVVGYLAVSRPFLNLAHPRHMHSSHSEIMLVREWVEMIDKGDKVPN